MGKKLAVRICEGTKQIRNKKRFISCVTACLLTMSLLTGCSTDMGGALAETLKPVKAGETISPDSKWINSDIDGAVTEDVQVDLKDDFHTAVNKEWILETKLDSENKCISIFSMEDDLLNQQKLAILKDCADIQSGSQPQSFETSVEIDPGLLSHDYDLVGKFYELAGNWDKRNELGAEPARTYIDAIENIETVDDIEAYLINSNGMNLAGTSMVDIKIDKSYSGEASYVVMLNSTSYLSLGHKSAYSGVMDDGIVQKQVTDGQVSYLLGRLGYSKKDIKNILKLCYRYEGRLADKMKDEPLSMGKDYFKELDNHYSLEELSQISPDFPITKLLESYGLGGQEYYVVTDPDYIKSIQKLYSVKYLDEIKSYFIVHTVKNILPLLDRESYDKYKEIEKLLKNNGSDDGELPPPSPDTESTKLSEDEEILLKEYFAKYLSGPLDQVYIARHCSKQQKEDIMDIVNETVDVYREMLLSEEWLSEEARQSAVEKLENMGKRAVYPNEFKDYTGLDFDSYEENGSQTGATLVDAVSAINHFRIEEKAKKAGKPFDRNYWDLDESSATDANSFYNALQNSIVILPGIMCTDTFYDENAGDAHNLGGIGTVIGHEITHAFDTTGSKFDKEGNCAQWWSGDDVVKFSLRANDLSKYYSSITPYPGAPLYNGKMVSSEAIADMGGMKCMLGIAKQKENFDYEIFFKTYARIWCRKCTLDTEAADMASDVHPLSFLRTNVTLQQFDEFYETFDIKPGDGMYLEPEKRIVVW